MKQKITHFLTRIAINLLQKAQKIKRKVFRQVSMMETPLKNKLIKTKCLNYSQKIIKSKIINNKILIKYNFKDIKLHLILM